jgi:peptidoglycan/LPS O-acetylase OafA/YrhL
VAVSQCSLVRLAAVARSYGVAVTSTTFVDDPFMQLSVLGSLPGTGSAAGAVFARQKLNLKGVSNDTVPRWASPSGCR